MAFFLHEPNLSVCPKEDGVPVDNDCGEQVEPSNPVIVAACNRNGLDLQSSRFSTGIDCVYPAPRTSIDCKRTCTQPLRPAIERNRPGLNATEKPMI
ncbi:hypothetical protein PSPPH_A0025 (plasmid) [Pseudomonas savastanoi pv. phaseolicola 1448A]|uniref:Uncharacterized protein n=1 Tax=Pseudomonas savastanoi pv. phaseolicola (strain 1448A / Race 6) TaxID=264730 RepID=Q48BD1_PSE14|nr:hypothetical protein PSPPH_A0025 [Pseudomonas savastanoi pv. phaseolicola 1448A]QDW03573.1 hypothetical protein FFH21_028820 [Pseudomonas sp. KBS0707]RMM81450.1 hypothetical protein ALQ72_06213 [Pseudomonas syringae pv. maculicola]